MHISTNLGRKTAMQIYLVLLGRRDKVKTKFTFILSYFSQTYSQFFPSDTVSGTMWKNNNKQTKQTNEEAQGEKQNKVGFIITTLDGSGCCCHTGKLLRELGRATQQPYVLCPNISRLQEIKRSPSPQKRPGTSGLGIMNLCSDHQQVLWKNTYLLLEYELGTETN